MKNITSITLTLLLIFSSIYGCNSKNNKKSNQANYSNEQNTEKMPENPPPGEVLIISDQIFDKTISKGIVMVDFWATWCAPCRQQGPIVEEIAKEMSGKVTVCKMDIDRNPSTPQKFRVEYIPTIIIFKDGKMFETFTGLNSKANLIASLNKALK